MTVNPMALLRRLTGRAHAPAPERLSLGADPIDVEDHLADYADGVAWVRDRVTAAFVDALGEPAPDSRVCQILVGAGYVALENVRTSLDPATAPGMSSPSMVAGAVDAVAVLDGVAERARERITEGELAFCPTVADVGRHLDRLVATEKARYPIT